ncbi:MAG: hypothetical protein FWH55_09205 [Oscillospiraceae bacterium]|nr:hypothetical protein [Oscillospiraceae bacterium]
MDKKRLALIVFLSITVLSVFIFITPVAGIGAWELLMSPILEYRHSAKTQ